MSHVAPPAEGKSFLSRLAALEPAMLRGVIVAVVGLLAVWGVNAADVGAQLEQTVEILFGTLLPLVTALVIRASVTPNAKVVQEVKSDGTLIAGPASPLPTGATILQPGERRTWDLGVDPDDELDEGPWPNHDVR